VHDELIAGGLIGTDEAGKGDYFGPLVCAACYVDSKTAPILTKANVRDSKRISNNRVCELAILIKAACPHDIIVILPEKYNALYAKFRNLNRLLAWAHAKAIENILEKAPCENVLTDQFGDEKLVQRALQEKGRQVNLIQRTKAEQNLAVAAASILARAEFLNRLIGLSKSFGVNLHAGAGAPTDQSAREFIKINGKDKLGQVAKLHFKNTQKAGV
jgi:ribonuclease HIII